jgi:choline transport protein
MSSASYLAAILPHLLTGRKNIVYGPFRLKGWLGYAMNFVGCGYMLAWFVIYSFPFALPVDAQNMNYACLIWGGLTIFVAVWWFIGARNNYEGPTTTGGTSQAEQIRRPSVELRKRSIQA